MTATGCRSLEMLCDFGDGRSGALEALHGAHYGDGDPDNWAAMTCGVQRFEGFAMHRRDSGEAARAMHSMECRIRRLSTASASPRASAEIPRALQRRIACATHPTCSASNTRECSEKQSAARVRWARVSAKSIWQKTWRCSGRHRQRRRRRLGELRTTVYQFRSPARMWSQPSIL
jgi:hypothetical protein